MSEDPEACCHCGITGPDVTFGPDPYASEIYNDQESVWECEVCREQSAMDI
jgi:hypothetical protein